MGNRPLSRAEFDAHANDYEANVRASLPELLSEGDYFSRYKVEAVVASQKGKNPQTILDFGCGVGLALQLFSEYFPGATLWGYDVSPLSIEHARDRVPSAALTSNLHDLPVSCFDVLFIANVFHHIPRDARLSAMKMCRDLLKPRGRIYVFEHNPYNPITRRVFERCSFDRGAQMLSRRTMLALAKRADLLVVAKRYTLFFPKQLAVFRRLESSIDWLPIGGQYYVELAK
jgi:trans-aconitate methyltransferase